MNTWSLPAPAIKHRKGETALIAKSRKGEFSLHNLKLSICENRVSSPLRKDKIKSSMTNQEASKQQQQQQHKVTNVRFFPYSPASILVKHRSNGVFRNYDYIRVRMTFWQDGQLANKDSSIPIPRFPRALVGRRVCQRHSPPRSDWHLDIRTEQMSGRGRNLKA